MTLEYMDIDVSHSLPDKKLRIFGDNYDSSFGLIGLESQKDYPLGAEIFNIPTHVIDIGAGYGEFSARCAALGALQIDAFEPNPRLAYFANLNLKDFKFATLHPKAVLDFDGESKLYVMQHRSAAGSISEVQYDPTTARALEREEIDIEVVNISNLQLHPDAESVLIKIDAEGSEYRILEALRKASWFSYINMVTIEYHQGLKNLGTVLLESGFSIQPIKREGDLGVILATRFAA